MTYLAPILFFFAGVIASPVVLRIVFRVFAWIVTVFMRPFMKKKLELAKGEDLEVLAHVYGVYRKVETDEELRERVMRVWGRLGPAGWHS